VHERAALTHERAATVHYMAAAFFEKNGFPAFAAEENGLGDREMALAQLDWSAAGAH
jgi:hypothetical protein